MSQQAAKESPVTAGRIVLAVCAGLIVLFAVLNSQEVRMHWLVTTTTMPLFVGLLVFALLGLLVGYVLGRRGSDRR
jgi:uncharacterized integral membrane protein